MKVLNRTNHMQFEGITEVGGEIACIMGCGGICLLAGEVAAAFGTAASLL